MEAQRWRQTGRGQLGYMLICLISVNLLHAGHSVPAHRLTCVCVSVCWGGGGVHRCCLLMLTATLHAAVEPFVSVFTVPLMGLDSVMKEPVSDGHSNPFFLQPEEAAITQTVAAPPRSPPCLTPALLI